MIAPTPESKNVVTNSFESKSNFIFSRDSEHFDGKVTDGVDRVSKVARDSDVHDRRFFSNFSTRSDFEDRDRHPHFIREFDDDQSQEARRILLSRFPRQRRTQSIPSTRRTDSHSTTQRFNEDYSNVQV